MSACAEAIKCRFVLRYSAYIIIFLSLILLGSYILCESIPLKAAAGGEGRGMRDVAYFSTFLMYMRLSIQFGKKWFGIF